MNKQIGERPFPLQILIIILLPIIGLALGVAITVFLKIAQVDYGNLVVNTLWLLFEGNWSNPAIWGIYALSVGEFLLGLTIVLSRRPKASDLEVI